MAIQITRVHFINCFEHFIFFFIDVPYRNLGCYRDHHPYRAPSGKFSRNIVDECYKRAKGWGKKFFAVRSTWCFTDMVGPGQTYARYGKTTGCKDGIGGSWMMNVYEIRESDTISFVNLNSVIWTYYIKLTEINRNQQKVTAFNEI